MTANGVILMDMITANVRLTQRLNSREIGTRLIHSGKPHMVVKAYIFLSLFMSLQLHISAYKAATVRLAILGATK